MLPNLLIVDGFYQDPDAIRAHATKQIFPMPPDNYPFSGRVSQRGIWDTGLQQQLSMQVGLPLDFAPNTFNGAFDLGMAKDAKKQAIQINPVCHLMGIVCLNTPNQGQDTPIVRFWQHKERGMEFCPRHPDEGAYYGFNSFEEIQEKLFMGDCLDETRWDNIISIPMAYNRLVLFEPTRWYTLGENFGTTKFDSRLTQLFFLNVQQVQRPIGDRIDFGS